MEAPWGARCAWLDGGETRRKPPLATPSSFAEVEEAMRFLGLLDAALLSRLLAVSHSGLCLGKNHCKVTAGETLRPLP